MLVEGATSVDSSVVAVDGIIDNQCVAPRDSIVRVEPLVLGFCVECEHVSGAGGKPSWQFTYPD